MNLRVLFRADASLEIGTGHIVRCATLAQQLRVQGHEVHFLCRQDAGSLNAWLKAQALPVVALQTVRRNEQSEGEDSVLCRIALGGQRYDWLVVDHYDLGWLWEREMTGVAKAILAIDDLGRKHACNLLLDQNYPSPIHQAYRANLPADCVLLGPGFALLRPEFARLRPVSLARKRSSLRRVLVFMGGSDPLNETAKVLNGIARVGRADLAVDVVVGASNPHRHALELLCSTLPACRLHVQTTRMAELMAAADCAIGAGGSTTWERCALGLPALVTILADNQVALAETVAATGAHRSLGWYSALTPDDYAGALGAFNGEALMHMTAAAADICDGHGVERVASRLASASN